MMFTLNPVCENSVLKAMPKLSPQLVMQNALNVMMKYVMASRFRPTAKTASTAKTKQDISSKGVVMEM